MAQETNVVMQPVLHYRDPEKALGFLTEAFGFREQAVHRGPDGEIAYVELEFSSAYFGFAVTAPAGDSAFVGARACSSPSTTPTPTTTGPSLPVRRS